MVDTGRPAEASAALDRSLALDPDNALAHNNRGSALELLGRMSEAEDAFARALDLAPDLAQPYLNLGHLLEKRGDAFQAVVLYERAIARGLDSGRFSHHVAAALGKPANRAPDSWVRATFDNFAPTFDAHLSELEYDAPRQLARMVEAVTLRHPSEILDLGCGTGQCGVALGGVKRRLSGVDLSEKMLALARARTCTTNWRARRTSMARCMPLRRNLRSSSIAADVFIYIGELEECLRGSRTSVPTAGSRSRSRRPPMQSMRSASGRYGQSRHTSSASQRQ